eukprot:5372367-Amphidinium_carterae.2
MDESEAIIFANCSSIPRLKLLYAAQHYMVIQGEAQVPTPRLARHRIDLSVAEGHGKRGRTASSSEDSDLIPLAQLADFDAAEPNANGAASSNEPAPAHHMSFHGGFAGGRVSYSQALWPGTTWAVAHSELNRAVKRRRNMWAIYIDGRPVDMAAQVPHPRSPYDVIEGTLRRLEAPLDYTALRAANQLAAPVGPSHTGIYGIPVTPLIDITGDADDETVDVLR